MTFLKLFRIATLVTATLACSNALAEDTGNKKKDATKADVEQTENEFEKELLYREYPTDERGSQFRESWDGAKKDTLSPRPNDPALPQTNRALSEAELQAITKESAGTEIHKVTKEQPITGGAKPEPESTPATRVPSRLRHRDRSTADDAKSRKGNKEK